MMNTGPVSRRTGLTRLAVTLALILTAGLWTADVAAADELAPGDRGAGVKQLQQQLTELGYDVGLVDGVYGNRTRGAVRRFQLDNDLPPTGKVDEATWQAVMAGGRTVAPTEEAVSEEPAADASELDDGFDLSEWGLGGGETTSMEMGGQIRTGYGAKFSDSDVRFPVLVYIDENTQGFDAADATEAMTYQANYAQLWWKGAFANNISAYAALDFTFFGGPERPFTDDLTFEVDEAYVTYAGKEISWTAGKEKINWGVMDLISPFNILNSANFLDPFVNTGLHDQRGQWGLHFNWDKVDEHRLEVFVAPIWNRSIVPMARTGFEDPDEIAADYWLPPIFAGIPELIWLGNAVELENGQLVDMVYYNEHAGLKEPPKDPSTFSLGARFLTTRGEYDLGAYFITSKDPKPTIATDLKFDFGTIDLGGNIGQRTVQLIYTRIQQDFSRVYAGGFSVETVKGKFRLKNETAVTYGRRYFPDIVSGAGQQELFRRVAENADVYGNYTEVGDRFAALHLQFGGEYTIPGADIITSLQLGYRHRFGYDEIYFGEADYVDLTFYAQKAFAENQFNASFSSLLQTTGGSGYVSPRLRYTPRALESVELGMGINWFFGESEEIADQLNTYTAIMGSFKNYSHIFLTGRYLFGFGL
jgi:hypothetical protein